MVNILLWKDYSEADSEGKLLIERYLARKNVKNVLDNKVIKEKFVEIFSFSESDLEKEWLEKIINFLEIHYNGEEMEKIFIFLRDKIWFDKEKIFIESNISIDKKEFIFLWYYNLLKIFWEKNLIKFIDFFNCDFAFFIHYYKFLNWQSNFSQILKKINYFKEKFWNLPKIYIEDKNKNFEFFIKFYYFTLDKKYILNEEKSFEENIENYLKNYTFDIPENLTSLVDEKIISWPVLADFLKKWIFSSEFNANNLSFEVLNNYDLTKIYAYLLNNKRKSFTYFLEILKFSCENDFEMDLSDFENLENFLKNDDFSWILEFSKKFEISEKIEKQLNNAIKHKNKEIIYKIFWEFILNDIEKQYKNWIVEIILEWFPDLKIDYKRIENTDFIEAFKICFNPEYNKSQWKEILKKYLEWKFDNPENFEIYNTERNIYWIKNNLTEEQTKVWLSKNKERFFLKDEDIKGSINNLDSRISHYYRVALKKISDLEQYWFSFLKEFENIEDFINYVESSWDFIKLKSYLNDFVNKYYSYSLSNEERREIEVYKVIKIIYNDLNLQIKEIISLLNKKEKISKINLKSEKIDEITIERETNPLRILQMWNLVEWSCLSYYSRVWNYYWIIPNATDVNKWIYCIYDKNNKFLARVIVSIWSDEKLTRYDMYFAKNILIDLDKYFNIYFKKLAEKMWFEINGSQFAVEGIECDNWYLDWEKNVD